MLIIYNVIKPTWNETRGRIVLCFTYADAAGETIETVSERRCHAAFLQMCIINAAGKLIVDVMK